MLINHNQEKLDIYKAKYFEKIPHLNLTDQYQYYNSSRFLFSLYLWMKNLFLILGNYLNKTDIKLKFLLFFLGAMESKQLEVVLKRWGKGSKIDKILSVTSEAAVPKGDNYLSVIARLKLQVVLGNGRVSRKNLIVKETIKDESLAKLVVDMGTFKTETMVFHRLQFL